MPSTGSTSPGSRSNVQLRQSCSGPQMPIDSAGSSPSSRRTIMVRFAHGQARATTSRYRPACTGKLPSRPSAVIRPFRYLVSRTNSPVALTLRSYPIAPIFKYPPARRLMHAPVPAPSSACPPPTPRTPQTPRAPRQVVWLWHPAQKIVHVATTTTIKSSRAGCWRRAALADAVPAGPLVPGWVVGGLDALGEQGGGAAGGVVGRPARVAPGDEVHPRPVDLIRDGLRGRATETRVQFFKGDGVEHERDLGAVARSEPVVVLRLRAVETVHPGAGRSRRGPRFGHPDGRDAEEPVADHGGQQVARAGVRPAGAVDGEVVLRQAVRARHSTESPGLA